jgi:DNA-binding NtrC family response regulator
VPPHIRTPDEGPLAQGDRIVGTSRRFREVVSMAGMVAHSDASVLISGESGRGQVVMAGYIHRST